MVPQPRWLPALALAAATTVLASTAVLTPLSAVAADGTVPTADLASTTALPTVQVDGVVWTQVVIGNTVYVGGDFTSAQPAGAAAGVGVQARADMLAYDLTTGALVASFAPTFNGQVRGLAASPDGSRLYAVGDFTTVNGVAKNHVVALDPVTGARITSFAAKTNSASWAVAATATTVYVGGTFTSADDVARSRAAAFDATTGALTSWAPVAADNTVRALVVSPDAKKVVLAGSFSSLNGSTSPGAGLGAVDAVTGTSVTWKVGALVYAHGTKAAFTSLSSDGTNVYGTGYVYGAVTDGNLEGTFSATWADGSVNWIEDCHGDTYSSAAMNGALYTASHAHYCGNVVDGFDQNDASSSKATHQRGLAFSTAAAGTLVANSYGSSGTYANFGGQPSPRMLTWYPTLTAGTYTGQDQAAWSVTTAKGYVLMGGEFPQVNGARQTGLVRFATRAVAPDTDGPREYSTGWTPTATSLASGAVRVAWQANDDRDDALLTYKVYRDGTTAPVYTTTATSRGWWYRPWLSFTDTGLTPGTTATYKVKAFDPAGNAAVSASVSAVVGSAANGSSAGRSVDAARADGATSLWRFDESNGPTVYDRIGGTDLTTGSGVTFGAAGAVSGDSAATFSGTSAGSASTGTLTDGPQTFSIETWFRTTSTAGGKLVGFGTSTSGSSASYDRHLYLDTSGHVLFGVYPNAKAVVQSSGSYNDGVWHQAVATLGAGGETLYVDGKQVVARTDVTQAQSYRGYWRVGGDSTWAGAQWFSGSIDETSLYPTALTAAQVANQFAVGTGAAGNTAPTASFTSSTTGLSAAFDASASSDADGSVQSTAWSFGDGTSGTGTTVTHAYQAGGTYTVTLTVTDDGGLTGTSTRQVVVKAANAAPTASFTSAASGLAATFDASGSTDQDGTIAAYAWDFGDGTTGSGRTATHTYAAAGSYTVRLTTTDDQGATGTTAGAVAVSAAVASDAFGRTVASGLGTADTGGSWTVSGGTTNASVSSGAAALTPAKSATVAAYLSSVASRDVDATVTVQIPTVPAGGSVFGGVVVRRIGSDDYSARLVAGADGSVRLEVLHGSTSLKSTTLSGLTATAGASFRLRFRAVGSGTTALSARGWTAGSTEPSTWQVDTTDATAALQAAGAVGLRSYLGSGVTNGPLAVRFDDFSVVPTS